MREKAREKYRGKIAAAAAACQKYDFCWPIFFLGFFLAATSCPKASSSCPAGNVWAGAGWQGGGGRQAATGQLVSCEFGPKFFGRGGTTRVRCLTTCCTRELQATCLTCRMSHGQLSRATRTVTRNGCKWQGMGQKTSNRTTSKIQIFRTSLGWCEKKDPFQT